MAAWSCGSLLLLRQLRNQGFGRQHEGCNRACILTDAIYVHILRFKADQLHSESHWDHALILTSTAIVAQFSDAVGTDSEDNGLLEYTLVP